MKLAFVVFILGILGIVTYVFLNRTQIEHGSQTINTGITPTEILLTQEEQCRKKILSDNNLFEDRMSQAVKTCKDTQICTYEDFRIWASANGQYVPDWKSENYVNIKTRECVENWPTPTMQELASPSAILSQ